MIYTSTPVGLVWSKGILTLTEVALLLMKSYFHNTHSSHCPPNEARVVFNCSSNYWMSHHCGISTMTSVGAQISMHWSSYEMHKPLASPRKYSIVIFLALGSSQNELTVEQAK